MLRVRVSVLVALVATLLASGPAAAQATTLALTKIPAPPFVTATDPIGYVYIVQNVGGATAFDVTLTDFLTSRFAWTVDSPSCAIDGTTKVLSCAFGNLPFLAQVAVSVTAPTVRADCATFLSLASLSAENAPTVTTAPSVTVGCPELSVRVFPDSRVARAPSAGFTIGVRNQSLATAKATVLRVSHTTLGLEAPGLPWNGICAPDGADIVCELGDVPGHGARSVHLRASAGACVATGFLNGGTTASNDIFRGSANELTMREAGDAEDDCAVGVSDVFYVINFLFAGGPAPK